MVRRRCYGVLHLSQHFGGPDRGPALRKSWHLGAGKQVRTPCGHYFHEDCLRLRLVLEQLATQGLTQWCQAHVSCPLCKSLVADPENPTPGEESV